MHSHTHTHTLIAGKPPFVQTKSLDRNVFFPFYSRMFCIVNLCVCVMGFELISQICFNQKKKKKLVSSRYFCLYGWHVCHSMTSICSSMATGLFEHRMTHWFIGNANDFPFDLLKFLKRKFRSSKIAFNINASAIPIDKLFLMMVKTHRHDEHLFLPNSTFFHFSTNFLWDLSCNALDLIERNSVKLIWCVWIFNDFPHINEYCNIDLDFIFRSKSNSKRYEPEFELQIIHCYYWLFIWCYG